LNFDYHSHVTISSESIISTPAYAIISPCEPSNSCDDLLTVAFVDCFGRLIQVKKAGLIWNGSASSQVMLVSGMSKDNPYGLPCMEQL
jgi:hypothetical protein